MQTHTIRSTGSLVVWSIGAVVALLALLDLALGDPRALTHAAAPVLLAVWALGLVLARPVIRYDDARLVVVNPLRVHDVGWGAVESIERRMQLEVAVADGSRFVAWASPALRRQARREPGTDWARDRLDAAREQGRVNAAPSDVRRRVDLPAAVVGAVLVVATVVGLLL